MSQIKEKFDWVAGYMTDWKLTPEEKCDLFLVKSEEDLDWDKIIAGMAAMSPVEIGDAMIDIAQKCDLIHRVVLNLTHVYKDHNEQHARWLRTPISLLNGQSPLEFVKGGDIQKLQQLVAVMENPHFILPKAPAPVAAP